MSREYGVRVLWSDDVAVLVLSAALTGGCAERVITIGDQRASSQQDGGPGAAQAIAPGPDAAGFSWPPIDLVFPEPSCRTGPLYVQRDVPPDPPNSLPIECDSPPELRPPWVTQFACDSFSKPIEGTPFCVDRGYGLSPGGEIVKPRGPADLAVQSDFRGEASAYASSICSDIDYVFCHRGGIVTATEDCGVPPSGDGGNILPGAYVLSGQIDYGAAAYPRPGGYIWQTLYMTGTSAFLVSGDGANFSVSATFTYAIDGAHLVFTAACEDPHPQHAVFPTEATYTAHSGSLELFDSTRQLRAMFTKIE